MFETSLKWLENGDIFSSGLGLIWYGMMWYCRYLDDLGYSLTIEAFCFHILFETEEGTILVPNLASDMVQLLI